MSDTLMFDRYVRLSGFEISGDEKKALEEQLRGMFDYAKTIDSVVTENIKPTVNPLDGRAKLREDKPNIWLNLDELQSNAPVRDKTAYLVPPQKAQEVDDREAGAVKPAVHNNDEYEAVIGLEVHAQLKTKTKLFCSCSTEFGHHPNRNTCPACSGHPGMLPVLNEEAVKMAVMAGLALDCTINAHSFFERKNYFYPDLPTGYQTSQLEEPICLGGKVTIDNDGEPLEIELNRIHMEEDAGKLVHVGAPGIWGSKASAVDFNRASIPLIEIVTEPVIKSAKHAKDYVVMLRSVLVQLGICDGNLEEGSLRCDANISIRKVGESQLGTKTEVKNMNSFRAIERAIEFEIDRQKAAVRMGKDIVQETRLWDENSQKTYSMRTKEEAHDYRYFPDANLLPLIISEEYVDSLRKIIPEYPLAKKYNYQKKCGLTEEQAMLLITNPQLTRYYDDLLMIYENARNVTNWFFNELLYYTTELDELHIKPKDFVEFLKKIDSNELSGKLGKEILRKSFDTKRTLLDIIEKDGYKQITDEDEILAMVNEVLEGHPQQVEEYRGGKVNLFGYFVGEMMKKTKGKANPSIVNTILKKALE